MIPKTYRSEGISPEKLAAKQDELRLFLEDMNASLKDFDWTLHHTSHQTIELVGKTYLIKHKKRQLFNKSLFQKINFDDSQIVSKSK